MAFGQGVGEFENDTTRILVSAATLDDDIEFTLVDTIRGGEYELIGATYGTFFAINHQELNPLYTGVEIDWTKVLNVLGSSIYKVRITQTTLNREFERETHLYHALPYNELAADGTMRIKSQHQGYFTNGLDYSHLNWVSMVRVPAVIVGKTPVKQDSDYVALEGIKRITKPIQKRTTTEWNLETMPIPEIVYNKLIYDNLLSDVVEITDYSVMSKEKLRNLRVIFDSVESVAWHPFSKLATWKLKLVEPETNIKMNRY
jgi:hypothetical protein